MDFTTSEELQSLLSPEPVRPTRPAIHSNNTFPTPAISEKVFKGMPVEVAVGFTGYIEALQGRANAYFATRFPMLKGAQIGMLNGRKYVKIVNGTSESYSVICFIEKATGQVWKAAGYKAPTLNFPRGNVKELGSIHQEGWGHFFAIKAAVSNA